MGMPKNNIGYPVRVKIGSSNSGTGFFLMTGGALYLVTAKHVLFNNGLSLFDDVATLHFLGSDLLSRQLFKLDCRKLVDENNLQKHAKRDVAVAKLLTMDGIKGKLVSGVVQEGEFPTGVSLVALTRENVRLFDEVEVANDTISFGYPSSLGETGQLDPERPLLRRGMVAGKTENQQIIIDSPVYFGDSGALVVDVVPTNISVTHYKAIGVVSRTVSFKEELYSKQYKVQVGIRFENSGYTMIEPMDWVIELVKRLEAAAPRAAT